MKLTQEPFLVNRAVSERESLPLVRCVNRGAPSSLAFTLIELLVVIAIVVVVAVLLVPAQSRTKAKTGQIECVNNLRQVIQAELNWVHDNPKNSFHWRVPVAAGGIGPDPVTYAAYDAGGANTWYQWGFLGGITPQSKGVYLADPKVLVCPADMLQPVRKVASDWWTGDTGLLNAGNRNNAVSYWVGTDAGEDDFVTHPKPPGYSASWMVMPIEKCLTQAIAGDRNINYNGAKSSCSAGPPSVWTLYWMTFAGNPTIGWTNAIHGMKGNIAVGDGHVAQVNQSGFTNIMQIGDDNGSIHILAP